STPRAVGPIATSTLAPTLSLSAALPEGARLVIGTADGTIRQNDAGGNVFLNSGLQGQDVAVAPDGLTLAYVRAGVLILETQSDNGRRTEVAVAGTAHAAMPSWSADGKQLSVIEHASDGDSVYSLALDSQRLVKLLTAPQIVAPARFNPATDRILIAEKTGVTATAFFSIASDCTGVENCLASRRDIASVNDDVTWADYHPNAASIVFSAQNGNLYLLLPGSGDVQPLLVDSTFKVRPTFNKDGSWLAFVDLTDRNRLMVMRFADHHVQATPIADVLNVDWVR
ncbi:MAG TPA: hypothetical protein VKQ72_04585, partial [Aggregatilineales bacterium]|nr:hypothetical protein [Aggregatilineales bacterium]